MITVKEFTDGLKAFYSQLQSRHLNAKTTQFMNEMPSKVTKIIQQRNDLLIACKAQHQAIDRLFASLIKKDEKFFPSKSGQPWKAIQQGNRAIKDAEAK